MMKFVESLLEWVLAICIFIIIFGGAFGAAICVVNWVLSLLGVI